MTTQTGVPGFTFTIKDFTCREFGDPGGATNIVDTGETFRLQLHFNGDGPMWQNLENLGLHYHVRFNADGVGIPDELNLGEVIGSLTPGGPPPGANYVAERSVSIANAGVYKCAASIYFYADNHIPFTGLLGFTDDMAVMVHHHEQ